MISSQLANEFSDSKAANCAFYAYLCEFRTGETLLGINRVKIAWFCSNSDHGGR
jgi:hypothetical protein